MNKVYLPAAITFLVGMIITIIGSLFKVMHWPGANIMLIFGMFFEVIAIIILIITLIKNSN